MPTSFRALELTVNDLFSNKYRFHIPDYQRQYSWQKDHAQQLYEDIAEEAFSSSAKIAEMRKYFAGSMVIVQKPEAVDALVIDGQQRLTTLTIMLAAIRDVAATKGIKVDDVGFAESVDTYIRQKGNSAGGIQASFQLHIRPGDSDFFQNNIQKAGGLGAVSGGAVLTDSQKRLVAAGKCFLEKLAELSDENVTRLGQYMLQRVAVAVVVTDDEESAFRIFTVLNDRGLDLSPADIIKADVIGGLPEKERGAFSVLWEDKERELGTDGFSELMSHIRMIAMKRKSKESTVKEIRESMRPSRNAASFINDIIVPYANTMAELRDEEIELTDKKNDVSRVVHWLRELRSVPYLGNSDWVPVALILVQKLREKPAELLTAFQRLETLTFGMMGLGFSISRRIERFGKVLGELQTSGLSPSLDLSEVEKTTLSDRLAGDLYPQYYCRYVLKRLDETISGAGARYEAKSVTVEHILPQNPADRSQWLQDFPDAKVRGAIVDRLGNLTLLTGRRNASVGNSDYANKVPNYFKKKQGHFVLTARLIADYKTWTLEDFERRQADLHSTCQEIWGLQTVPTKA